jgi:hypothetical protein
VDERARALEDIVAIAQQHGVSADDIAAALGSTPVSAHDSRRRGVLVRVLGVLGGTFVFAGVGVFIALQWDALNAPARVVVTLGSGLAAFALAAVSTRDARFDKATAPLFLMAAALEPTGMFVAFDEFGSGGDWRLASLITCGAMAAQFGLTFAAVRQATLLFLTMFFAVFFWWTAFDLADADGTVTALVLGASILLAAAGVGRTVHRIVTPFWYLAGAAAFLGGLFDALKRTPFEIVFLAVAAGFVYASVVVHSRTLLVVAVLAILAYTGWFTGEHFVDSIGWPLALVAFGLFMIGLSALAVRIDRDYVRSRAERASGSDAVG